ncbi:MAG: DUF1592 domain-containing protein, partial [Isosphaeraceae bacterium]|nr:DUF1592 domain-containing protein [Isosphaeraceae bacterium]
MSKRPLIAALGVVMIGLGLALAPETRGAEASAPISPISYKDRVAPLLAQYCARCHGERRPKGGLNLLKYTDEELVIKDRATWQTVLDYLKGRDMPPPDRPQPTDEEYTLLTSWIEAKLASDNCGIKNPGRVTIRRLNRAEYNNTIRDLIGINFRPADDFPSDDVGYGFDNIGDVLSLPPLLMEKYLAAAEQIAEQVILVPEPPKGPVSTFAPRDWQGGQPHGEGRILASTGEIVVTFDCPEDGEYIARIRAYGDQAGDEPVKMALRLDGEEIRTVEVTATEAEPKTFEVRGPVRRGKHRIAVAFLNDYWEPKHPDPSKRDRNLIVTAIQVEGPLQADSRPKPESHRRIIFREPKDDADRKACARAIIERFATRAYRRPVRPQEVERLLSLYELAEADGEPFERGIQLAVEAALVSPHFLFRAEVDRGPGFKGTVRPLGSFELASRLSYFLWSSMPDDELFQAARDGSLKDDQVLAAQARRMLKDPKAHALVENFADQWLTIRNLKTFNPDPAQFPSWDESLRSAMQQETELFFEAVMREDRSLLDFLDADFTFLNERLAKHYGIEGVKGDEFRRVALPPESPRGGVLTMASVLAVTSNPTRTSPVKRGKWILEQLLGTP